MLLGVADREFLDIRSARCTGGAPLGKRLIPFKRIDADPNKSYPLTAENGPWLIMAATFSGEKAREQAQELVYELRMPL